MNQRLKRLATSAGLVGALGIGAVLMIPSKASAATPCGLSGVERDVPFTVGNVKLYYYTIRQCYGSTIKRKLDVAGDLDGPCKTIRAFSQISDVYGPYLSSGYVKGIKPC